MGLKKKALLAAILSQSLAFITGTPGVGNVLTANLNPTAGTASTWQWLRNGSNIGGATSSTYTQVTADLGTTVSVLINSTYTGSIGIPGIAPAVTTAPSVSSASTSSGLTWTPGVYTGTPTPTVVANAYVNGTLAASNITQGSYTPSPLNGSLVVTEVVSNVAGSVTSSSSPVTITAVGPLRFASPTNAFPSSSESGVTTTGVFLNGRFRMPVWIGSGDRSRLRVTLSAFYIGPTGVTAMANGYNVVKLWLEKDGSSSIATCAPITFGGLRTTTVAAGAYDVQCDDILPSALGFAKFTYGDKYWIRGEYSVNTAGQKLPAAPANYTGSYPASLSIVIDPATYTGGAVDSFGQMNTAGSQGTNWANTYQTPFVPILLGSFVSGDPKTILHTGDSIDYGTGDTATTTAAGAIQRALWDSDGVSNPIGGCKMACAGATAILWTSANAAFCKAYMKYAKYLLEEFGTNEFLSTTNTLPATAEANSQAVWAAWYASETKNNGSIIKPKLTPRCNLPGTGTTTTASGTTATFNINTSSSNVPTPTVGQTVTVSGLSPAAFNGTFVVTATGTNQFSYTMGSAPGSNATGTGNWYLQMLAEADQTVINPSWAASGGARDFNAWIDTQVSAAALGTIVPLASARISGATEGTDAFYHWAVNGAAAYNSTDGVHPVPGMHLLEAAEYRTYFAALA